MTNSEPLKILKKNVDIDQNWPGVNLALKIDLRRINLRGIALSGAKLIRANLREVYLNKANLI